MNVDDGKLIQLAHPTDAMLMTPAHGGGAHGALWIVATLLLVLTEMGVLAWALRPLRQSRSRGAPGATHPATDKLLLAGAVMVAASVAFMVIAFEVGAGGSFVRVERVFAAAVHGMASARTQQFFAALTHLGDGLMLALLCIAASAVLLWRHERLLVLGLVAAIGGNGLLNALLKRVFERMRPPLEHGLPAFHGWGFPSGHASGSVVAFGILAYVLVRTLPKAWHRPVLWPAATATLLVGTSRLVIEAHYAGDVLAGFASGTAWLAACILGLEMRREFRRPAARHAGPLESAAVSHGTQS